jgi:hypothetical protein
MRRTLSLSLVMAASISLCAAQASYGEGFDDVGPVLSGQHGPSNLIAAGWIFRNQSQPVGTGSWHGEASDLAVDSTVAGAWSSSAGASSWAILPAIPNQVSGDVLRFSLRQDDYPCCTPQARLQVRYSPGGGTSTGLGVSGVGSFTTLLLDIPQVEGRPWTEQSVTLPGNGRIAFRFYLPPQALASEFVGDVRLDSLTVGLPPGGESAENFENLSTTDCGPSGPEGLISRGWEFRNQSAPVGAYGYCVLSGNGILPPAHSGQNYLAVTDAAAETVGDPLNAWAILPVFHGQRAGDLLSFALFTHLSSSGLEVRYSPGGGVSTGSGPDGVGDFTQVLGATDVSTDTWVPHQFVLPGAGRVAFRYRGTRAAFNLFADFLAIDTVSVGVPPSYCNMPPMPAAGETVHWSMAASPYRLCLSSLIPAGSAVIVDPGVRVDVDAGHPLTVLGSLELGGTAAAPVVMAGVGTMVAVGSGGTLRADFAQLGGGVSPGASGTLLLSDTSFQGPNGRVFGDLFSGTGFGQFERVTFSDSEFTISNYTLVVRDVTLHNSVGRLTRDYPLVLENVTADGQPFDVDAAPQGTWLDTIAVADVTSPPGGQTVYTGFGLGLTDGNFLIGPNVSLTNNTYPVRIVSAGILPGSTLPATGNINDLIYVPGGDHGGASTIWADAGLPYFIAGSYAQYGGSLKMLEGVQVKLAPFADISSDPSPIDVFGTEERPVTFEQASSGEPWGTLDLFYRIRHAVIDGATVGATWRFDAGWGFLDSSTVRNCSHLGAFDAGIIKKTLFQNNFTGASVLFNQIDLSGDTNPNAFEGNGVGVTAAGNARNNWWGSPTGPTAVDNPQGTGDSVESWVPYLPFRTSRPDFDDAPPIVDLEQHSLVAHPGDKLILTWKASDDGAIVSQRVLLSMNGDIVQENLPEPVIVLAQNLPGSQRSIEFVVPAPMEPLFGSLSNLRVESTDGAGQVGWDDLHFYVEADEPGQLVLTSPLLSEVTAGANLGTVCWQPQEINPLGGVVEAYLLLESTGQLSSLGGVPTSLTCLSGTLTAPFVSTDRARIVLSRSTSGGQATPEYFFGPVFSIRPDPRVGDAPPTVAITEPAPGLAAVGATLGIRWTASDDGFVRVVHVQASTDGGRTWSFLARDLPGDAGAYDWALPPTTTDHEVQIKVVAVDERFQDSSDVAILSIGPSSVGPGEANASRRMAARRGPGSSVVVDYLPACGASDHVVYWGTAPIAGGLQWNSAACGLGTSGTASFDPGDPPPGGLVYFVVVGQDATHEGSYGRYSSGAERPEAVATGSCDRPRASVSACDGEN